MSLKTNIAGMGRTEPAPHAAADTEEWVAAELVRSPTEDRNPATAGIDALDTLGLLQALNEEDAKVAPAVRAVLPQLAGLVDVAVARIRAGGSVHYVGAGTSGRLAVLDAAELLPTFHVPDGMFVAHLAGGQGAFVRALENVEDDPAQGAATVAEVGAGDVVVGLTASGRTPFVAGALDHAGRVGAATALITANPRPELADLAEHVIAPDTGAEAVTGSTRLKAGTAQKLVLNAFSTAIMVRLGRTWSNLMVDMVATNAKLRGRMLRILAEASGADTDTCRAALERSGGDLKPALVHLLGGLDVATARELLARHDGVVAAALADPDAARARGATPSPPPPADAASPRPPAPPTPPTQP